MYKRYFNNLFNRLNTEQLLDILDKTCGHYTIFKFSTEYKVALDTPDLDVGEGRWQVLALPGFKTLHEAVVNAIMEDRRFIKLPPDIAAACRSSAGIQVVADYIKALKQETKT